MALTGNSSLRVCVHACVPAAGVLCQEPPQLIIVLSLSHSDIQLVIFNRMKGEELCFQIQNVPQREKGFIHFISIHI